MGLISFKEYVTEGTAYISAVAQHDMEVNRRVEIHKDYGYHIRKIVDAGGNIIVKVQGIKTQFAYDNEKEFKESWQ